MNIKYVFLGNSETLKEIGEYPNKAKEDWSKNCKQIFQKYCNSSNVKFEQRNAIRNNPDGNIYFIIMPSNIFYFVISTPEYPERQVFQLIEELHRDSIYLLTDEKGELNKIGKQSLKNIVESYQKDTSKVKDVSDEVEDIKIEMKKNINKAIANVEDAQALDQKATKIKDSSHAFKRNAAELKKITCWQNCKWTIILVLLIIGVILIIVVPVAISASKGSSSDTSNNTNNGNNNAGTVSATTNGSTTTGSTTAGTTTGTTTNQPVPQSRFLYSIIP
jgi:hypothetical protein